MKSVTLPIFHNNEKTRQLETCGLECKLEDNDLHNITFYNISYITEYRGNNKYTVIGSNGEYFICSYNLDRVETIINLELK